MIVAIGMITLSFPLGIKTGTIVTFFTVGLAPFFVALWAQPRRTGVSQGDPYLHIVLPATLTLSLASILRYLIFLAENIGLVLAWLSGQISLEEVGQQITRAEFIRAQRIAEAALVTMQVWGGLLLLPFLKPPSRIWVGGEPLSRDWRYAILAAGLFVAYGVILVVPGLRNFFKIYPLELRQYLAIGGVTLVWAWVLRYTWRHRRLDRFLGITLSPF